MSVRRWILQSLLRPREALSRAADIRERARFRRVVAAGAPVAMPTDARLGFHVFFGRRSLHEAIATAKSFLRHADDEFRVVLHEDGSVDASGRAMLEAHLRGSLFIPRARANDEVISQLRRRGLPRSAALREEYVFGPKLFDVQHYSLGGGTVYADTDVLFLEHPTELLAAAKRVTTGVPRYNRDIHSSYSWSADELRQTTGLTLPAQFNSGLLVSVPEQWDVELIEKLIALPVEPSRRHFLEQTITALVLTARGATPLPNEYDVCFRHAVGSADYGEWMRRAHGSEHVATQHYCCGQAQRAYYYRHFNTVVAPALERRS